MPTAEESVPGVSGGWRSRDLRERRLPLSLPLHLRLHLPTVSVPASAVSVCCRVCQSCHPGERKREERRAYPSLSEILFVSGHSSCLVDRACVEILPHGFLMISKGPNACNNVMLLAFEVIESNYQTLSIQG